MQLNYTIPKSTKLQVSKKALLSISELVEGTCRENRSLKLDGQSTCNACHMLFVSMWNSLFKGYKEADHQKLMKKKEGSLKCDMSKSIHYHCLFEGKDVGCLHTSKEQAQKHVFGRVGTFTECGEYCVQHKGYVETFIKNVTLKTEEPDKPEVESGAIFSHRSISHSELKAFASCKRQWDLGYQQELTPRRSKPSPALSKGTLFHSCVEEYYRRGKPGQENLLNIFDEKILELQNSIGHKITKKCDTNYTPKKDKCSFCNDLDYVYTMLQRYHVDAENWDENKVLVKGGLEYRFEEDGFPIFGEPWPLNWKIKGFIDMIQRDKTTGVVELVDHKTTSYTFHYWRRNTLLELKWQALIYLIVMQHKLPKMKFNVIWRVSRTKGTKDLLTWEYEASFSKTEIERAKKVIANRAYEIAMSLGNKDLIYPNPSHAKCNMCAFNLICDKMNAKMDSPKFHQEMNFLYMKRERH